MNEHLTDDARRERRRAIDREGARKALAALEAAMRRGGYTVADLDDVEVDSTGRNSAA